ncbi:hypothetical protein KSD_78510 [Ktedonobacter sp. SOSP1-85]|nr:hypothetical protein KSD_78510 [Ktedonobacter sp. SOSP1-85]
MDSEETACYSLLKKKKRMMSHINKILDRRRFLGTAAMTLAATQLSMIAGPELFSEEVRAGFRSLR